MIELVWNLVVAGAGLLRFSAADGVSFRQLHGSVLELSAVAGEFCAVEFQKIKKKKL